MQRPSLYFAFVGATVLLAGAFGAIHDQISYTVSPEYFTRFKFDQFRLLDPAVPERLRAAMVGFLASWWMGVPLGLLSGLAGFIHRDQTHMQKALFRSLPVIAGFVLLVALIGLGVAYRESADFAASRYQEWNFPEGVKDARRFYCAGSMHNSAYLGGALSILVAWIFHLVYWWHARKSVSATP